MITISRDFEWDMGHRVTNHDSLCKNPHGHRYKMQVTITGLISQQVNDAQEGMIVDFGRLKKAIQTCVVQQLDHAFMYWEKDSVMNDFAHTNQSLKMIKVPFIPTAECIATYIADELIGLLQQKFKHTSLEQVVVYETPNCSATWRKQNER